MVSEPHSLPSAKELLDLWMEEGENRLRAVGLDRMRDRKKGIWLFAYKRRFWVEYDRDDEYVVYKKEERKWREKPEAEKLEQVETKEVDAMDAVTSEFAEYVDVSLQDSNCD